MRYGIRLEREAIKLKPDVDRALQDAERLQKAHPPPLRAIVVKRSTGAIVGVIPTGTQMPSRVHAPRVASSRSSRGTSRESRPGSHRVSRTRTARAGPDDADLPLRSCLICEASLAGRRRHASTCSSRCRKALQRRKEREEQEALARRHEAAWPLLKDLTHDQRLDMLAAVVWPTDARLSLGALGDAA
jgi:hypothetical protein